MSNSPNIPNIESYEQLLSDMLSAYQSSLGVNDTNIGSVNLSFFQVVALTTARTAGNLFQTLRDQSIDLATGDALQRIAAEFNIIPVTAAPSVGPVTVVDSSFTKIASTIYTGQLAPNIGSTTIYVSDASLFPATGSVYLGRGTNNIEGPLPYTSVVQTGSYWTMTLNPLNPTTRYHNLGESVILSQKGLRPIPANTIVIAPGIGATANIQYGVITTANILDGETTITNVIVSALLPGSAGNVPIGAINSFAAAPFPGATVTNPLPMTTGQDTETDPQLRVQIKNAMASIGLGTATAIESALLGAQALDPVTGQTDTIVSDSLVQNVDGSCTVYINNGTVYEATTAGVGIETIILDASGGQQFFQLQTGGSQAPVAKAFLQTTNAAPFALFGGEVLAVTVGEITYQHIFASTDFLSPGAATAYEVVASINADSALGFEAVTAGGGIYVVIRAKVETFDSIQIALPTITTGTNASTILEFPANLIETLRLYKNNIPLTKDGLTASVFTQAQGLWSSTITNGDTLILSVDNTAPIIYTITNTDFINTGLYTFVASTNSLASWVEVFNDVLTGVTASIVGNQIELTSNLGTNNRASVVISGSSTLVDKGMFSASLGLSSTGHASDFTLDRNTAQFELAVPLVAGDDLSAGDADTEAFLLSADPAGTLIIPSDAHLWFLMDTPGTIIPTGAVSGTTVGVKLVSPDTIQYISGADSFSNVEIGDYVIVWSPEIPAGDQIEGRVRSISSTTVVSYTFTITAGNTASVGAIYQDPVSLQEFQVTTPLVSGSTVLYATGLGSAPSASGTLNFVSGTGTGPITYSAFTSASTTLANNVISILVTAAEWAVATTYGSPYPMLENGFVVVRTTLAPQKFRIQAGTKTLYQIATELQTQTENATFSVVLENSIQITTNTMDTTGSLLLVTADDSGSLLQFTIGASSQSTQSLIAFENSQNYDGSLPLFINSVFSDAYANPIDSFINSVTSSVNISTRDPNELIGILQPFGTTGDQYEFVVTAASANAGDTYTNNGQTFTVNYTITGATTLFATSSGTAPTVSGNLVRTSGSGTNPIVFSSVSLLGTEIRDAQPFGEYVQETTISSNSSGYSTVGITDDVYLRRVRGPIGSFDGDRFFIANPLDFGYNDTLVTILDENVTDETFTIPLFRPALTNTSYPTNPSNFNAYDVLSGPTTQFVTNFGDFDFSNFKVLMRAKHVLAPDPGTNTAILYRATQWGRSGQYVTVAYVYPSSANQPVGSLITIGPTVAIDVILSSGTTINTTITASTQWNITITANTPIVGVDQVTYTWNSVGTAPGLTLSGGEYVNITTQTGFPTDDTGVFRVSTATGFTPTATSFSVQVPHGTATAASNAPTLVNGAITFYEPGDTTAAEVATYVNANLSAYISATLVPDPLITGSGVITYSTYENGNFTSMNVQLSDGINWIYNSNLSTVPIQATGNTFVTTNTSTGNTNDTSNILTNVTPTNTIQLGATVSGAGIQAGSTVVDIEGTNVTISLPATASAAGINIGFTATNTLTGVFPTGGIEPGATVTGTGIGGGTTVISVNGSNVAISQAATSNNSGTSLTFINTGSPQFILKRPLSYSIDPTPVYGPGYYSFNNGETIEFSPTTVDQVQRLISIFAVSGFITDGTITLSDREKYLTLATDTLGSLGAIQVASGLGNEYSLPILGSASLIGNSYMAASVNNVASQGVASDQWFRLQAEVSQKKIIGFSSNTDVEVTPNVPLTGSSEISVSDRLLTQRYFGKARNLSLSGNIFRIEHQGDLVCITYTGSDPTGATTSLLATNYSNSDSGTVTITLVANTNDAQYFISGSGTFSSFSIGDYIAISGLAQPENNGTFLVTGISDPYSSPSNGGKTIQVTNPNAVAASDSYSAGDFTGTIGVSEGDTLFIGPPFAALNQGKYRVIRRFADSVWIENPNAVEEEQTVNTTSLLFYEYEATVPGDSFVITGNVLGANNAGSYVITAVLNALGGHYNDTIVVGSTLTQTVSTEPRTALVTGNTEVTFSIPTSLTTNVGDTVTIGATTLVITSIVTTNLVVMVAGPGFINGSGQSALITHYGVPVNLLGNENALYVLEGVPYSGYKQVYLISAEPDTASDNEVLFNTIAQYEKVNQAGGVEMTSLNKLDFNTAIQVGLDAYRYNTGLIRVANQIVYGDPRDPVTYPGVGAAGADIFIREPLVLRVQISVDIRLQTGAPFAQVAQQVQSNIVALINSNPVGQSIAISAIVSTIMTVPGVISTAINSPLYNIANDLIVVQPSEKTYVVNPSTDISVSQIGT
jgi:uncharacterized phage protein gp47/JayE